VSEQKFLFLKKHRKGGRGREIVKEIEKNHLDITFKGGCTSGYVASPQSQESHWVI
jgi:hypothetical protein